MENKNNNCVYCHKNKINGKLYIGITNNPTHRWGLSGLPYQNCVAFYRAIRKYGWDNFDHIVLIDNLSREQAEIFETFLIQKYKTTDSNFGYNISSGGYGGNPYGSNPNPKPVYQYDLNGTYIREFSSRKEASCITGVNDTDIGVCARNFGNESGVQQAGGYIWTNEKYESISPFSANRSPYIVFKDKAIYQLDLNGNIIREYKDIYDIPDNSKRKRKREHILNCIRGKRLITQNSFWCYKTDYSEEWVNNILQKVKERKDNTIKKQSRVLYQCDKNMNILNEYINAKNASENTGVKTSTIQAACKGRLQHHFTHGYYWIYKDEYEIIA